MPSYVIEDNPELAAATGDDGVGGTYEQITDHAQRAVDQLIDFFRNGPRNRAVVRAIGRQIQELEDVVWALSSQKTIDDAVGHRLDQIGYIVGESRSGRTDTDYRAAIRIRMLINRANGTIPEFATVLAALLPLADISIGEAPPAAFRIDVDDLGSVSASTIRLALEQMKPGGVALDASYGFEAGRAVGAEDGDPAGGAIGAEDGDPAGFKIAGVL